MTSYLVQRASSPALSTASTADGQDDLGSSPVIPQLSAPSLPPRAQEYLRTPSPNRSDEAKFGTASWGSPYLASDRNLRQHDSDSEASDDSPIHQLALDTPFLRQVPTLERSRSDGPVPTVNAAAAVLANRARRLDRSLTEDWIRTHTTGDASLEPRHWFSDGSGSEPSSLSGSENDWQDGHELQTPKPPAPPQRATDRPPLHPRSRSSIDTLRPSFVALTTIEASATQVDVRHPNAMDDQNGHEDAAVRDVAAETAAPSPVVSTPNGEPKTPTTPLKGREKPLPKAPVPTPRIKKKVPWKGKNILVLIPRDEDRGFPGNPPMPLRQHEVDRMFSSWEELGYKVDGFDLLVEGYQPTGTDDSQSRGTWPDQEDVLKQRVDEAYQVTLPDLNGDFNPPFLQNFNVWLMIVNSVEGLCERTTGGETSGSGSLLC